MTNKFLNNMKRSIFLYKKMTLLFFISIFFYNAAAQNVSITSNGAAPDASAMLDIQSGTKGLSIPNVALVASNSTSPISATPKTGLIVYNTATAGANPNNVVPGFYYWNGTAWIAFSTGLSSSWSLTGNAGTVDGTNFIGTTDNIPFTIRVNNQQAGRIDNALNNIFFGYQSGLSSTGMYNAGYGAYALYANTTGGFNTSSGAYSLFHNNGGSFNIATGYSALTSNVSGSFNIATGNNSLSANISGNRNTATGYTALYSNTTGTNNTAYGASTLYSNIAGTENTVLGYAAGYNCTGSGNVYIGNMAGYSANSSNELYIANSSAAPLIYGNFSSGNVGFGTTSATNPLQMSSGAFCTSAGVWTNASDRRLKENICTSSYGLAAVMKLRPVTYTMKKGGEKQVGFIAQEVQQIIPEVISGKEGDISKGETMGVSYGNMVAVLTKAIQEQEQQILEQQKLFQAQIEILKKEIEALKVK